MDDKKKMNFEEFKMNRREGFLEGISFGIVVLIIIVLLIIMMISEVDNSYIYRFRTIAFIIGIAYWIDVSARFYKLMQVQKVHPEWLADTSAFKNTAEVPRAWKMKRWAITVTAVIAAVTAFFILYKPGTGIENHYNDFNNEDKAVQEIIDDTTLPQNNEDFQKAMDIINSLNVGNEEAETGE